MEAHIIKECAEMCSDVYRHGEYIHKPAYGYQIFAFAGTNDPLDWITNMRAYSKEGMHAGFYYEALFFDSLIKDKAWDDVPVILTGHSLGGAIAVCLADKFIPTARAVTFGAPRTHRRDARIDSGFSERVTQFGHRLDIVTHVPFIKYRHVSRVKRFGWMPRSIRPARHAVLVHEMDAYKSYIRETL